MKNIIRLNVIIIIILLAAELALAQSSKSGGLEPENSRQHNELAGRFQNPPDSARPGVYWYFMDGNMDREETTADLEAMKQAGIGNLVFLEVNVGVPRGTVDFMSEQWQDFFVHAVRQIGRAHV